MPDKSDEGTSDVQDPKGSDTGSGKGQEGTGSPHQIPGQRSAAIEDDGKRLEGGSEGERRNHPHPDHSPSSFREPDQGTRTELLGSTDEPAHVFLRDNPNEGGKGSGIFRPKNPGPSTGENFSRPTREGSDRFQPIQGLEGEDNEDPQTEDLGDDHLYFRLQILEAIANQSSDQVKLELCRLLEGEGKRSEAIAGAEVRGGLQLELETLKIQRMEAEKNLELLKLQMEADTKSLQENRHLDKLKIDADTESDIRADKGLRHALWRETVTIIAPVIFATVNLVLFFLFHKWQMTKAADAFEKILIMLITGALGWAAGRSPLGGIGQSGARAGGQ